MLNLFISPQRHQYYFGDYYGAEYAREGFHPWYEAREHHDWYDPIFVHQQWQHRDDRQWVTTASGRSTSTRRDDESLRPARTYEAMRAQVARLPEKDRRQVQVARPMKEVVADKTTPFKFARRGCQDSRGDGQPGQGRACLQGQESAVGIAGRRAQGRTEPKEPVRTPAKELPKPPTKEVAPPEKVLPPERGPAVKEPPTAREAQSERIKIPKSPIAVREPVTDKALAPPPRPKQPNPDLTAQPKSAMDAPTRDAPGGPGGPTPNPKGDRP